MQKYNENKSVIFLITFFVVMICMMFGCGGGGNAVTTYTVGGRVSGLTGSGLILQNNKEDDLEITKDGTFIFLSALADGEDYSVTIKTQASAPDQVCSVSKGSGKIASANISNVLVTCEMGEFPTIFGIGITLSPYDSDTNFAGDVDFGSDVADDYGDRVFIEFGGLLVGQPNVHPTFIVPLGTKIHAVSPGIVHQVQTLGDNDYDICVYRNADDEWCVSYEHVKNPEVSKGDTVEVGDVIGEAGEINEFTDSGKFDLKIWKGGSTIIDYCPYALFDSSVASEMQAKINRFVSDWEEYIGKDVYNTKSWISPGCVVETLEE